LSHRLDKLEDAVSANTYRIIQGKLIYTRHQLQAVINEHTVLRLSSS